MRLTLIQIVLNFLFLKVRSIIILSKQLKILLLAYRVIDMITFQHNGHSLGDTTKHVKGLSNVFQSSKVCNANTINNKNNKQY